MLLLTLTAGVHRIKVSDVLAVKSRSIVGATL